MQSKEHIIIQTRVLCSAYLYYSLLEQLFFAVRNIYLKACSTYNNVANGRVQWSPLEQA